VRGRSTEKQLCIGQMNRGRGHQFLTPAAKAFVDTVLTRRCFQNRPLKEKPPSH
jgi:hypothetical protein